MTTEPFTLTPSPADPQPVKVFMLDDYEWWAGYTLEGCIAAAREQAGGDCYEDAERDGYQLTFEQMAKLQFTDEESEAGIQRRSFAAELQRRIDAGEQFPQFFAATEG